MFVVAGVVALVFATTTFQVVLDAINLAECRRRADDRPAQTFDAMDRATYERSVEYTLAKGRLAIGVRVLDGIATVALLALPVLPWSYASLSRAMGTGLFAQAAFLILLGIASMLFHLPTAYYAQFGIEQRFGFNRSGRGLWVLDRIKGLSLALAIGAPLLLLLLWAMRSLGPYWWVWGFFAVTGVQVFIATIFPRFILPLFHELKPLSEGPLRTRLFALAHRARFQVTSLHVMDGSKRSTHSNAFFAGMGRFRRIILFDTLLATSSDAEIEAVLAHEIGHSKLGHIRKSMLWGAMALLLTFTVVGRLVGARWLAEAFSLPPDALAPSLVVIAIAMDGIGFWGTPLGSWLSRKHEYEADAFARAVTGGCEPLISALRKLAKHNLSNRTPHRWFVWFYSSHPTLEQREAALRVARPLPPRALPC